MPAARPQRPGNSTFIRQKRAISAYSGPEAGWARSVSFKGPSTLSDLIRDGRGWYFQTQVCYECGVSCQHSVTYWVVVLADWFLGMPF